MQVSSGVASPTARFQLLFLEHLLVFLVQIGVLFLLQVHILSLLLDFFPEVFEIGSVLLLQPLLPSLFSLLANVLQILPFVEVLLAFSPAIILQMVKSLF